MVNETVSDTELLDAWREGDVSSGEVLFRRHYDAIFRFFRDKAPETHLADLVQQTFTACVEGRDRIRQANFRGYLYGVAYNILRVYYRTRNRSGQPMDFAEISIADLAPGPQSLLAERRERRLLLEALRHIPLEHQVLLELRYWQHLKTIEIAEILDVPHPTLRTRLRRAHGLLEKAIAELADSESELASTLADLNDWARKCREAVKDEHGYDASDDGNEQSGAPPRTDPMDE